MDYVDCNGSEQYIQDCSYNTEDDCGPGDAAGVLCYGGVTTTTTTTPRPTTSTTTTQRPTTTTYYTTQNNPYYVELIGGDGHSFGNVYAVNKYGNFGPVCDDNFDSREAEVVCR